jgi:dihydrodipicolinate synthase/N-acetylneuraminate lyase
MTVSPLIQKLIADPIANYPIATVACFDPTTGELPRRILAEWRTVEFLEKLAEAGAPAVLIAASTGQGHLRTVEELAEWYSVAARAKLGSTMLTALLRPEDGVASNERLARFAAELGYSVAFVRPGRDLPAGATDQEIAANIQPIVHEAAQAGLAVGLYSIPDVSGVAMSPEAAARVLLGPGGDRIVAIKVTEANYEQSTLRFLRDPRLAHLKIVQGWDPHLARALQDGPKYDAQGRNRCGVTSGPMCFALYQYFEILSAASFGMWDEVAAAQEAVTALFQAMQTDPQKFADLQRAKYIMGLGHSLTGRITDDQVERVFAALKALPRLDDQSRLARSLDLMGNGPYHQRLKALSGIPGL